MTEKRSLMLDSSITEAVDAWISHGLEPGSCTTLLLKGDYDNAFLHAHPLLKPHWHDHILYIESLPKECRGENMAAWQEAKEAERQQKPAAS